MNFKITLNICLKVVGICYALKALDRLLSGIPQILLFWGSWKMSVDNDLLQTMLNYKASILASLFMPLILFAISLVVIFKSDNITRAIFKDEDDTRDLNWGNVKILNISIKIIGFFSFLSSIPPIASLLSKYWIMKDSIKLYDNKAKIELASSGFLAILYICFGIFLIICSAYVAEKVSFRDQTDKSET